MKKEQLSEMEMLIKRAKESKHMDAILLLIEQKPNIQKKVAKTISRSLKNTWNKETDKAIWMIKNIIWLVAEYVFEANVSILENDKA